jgi:hypothetical protein
MLKKTLLFLLLTCCFFQFSSGQKLIENEKRDTLLIYKSIEDVSNQNALSKLLYKSVFHHTTVNITNYTSQQNHKLLEGKIIRKITIINLNPFSCELKDSTFSVEKLLNNVGNATHVNTLSFTIKNLLLFKKNQRFDSLRIKESERLIRGQKYVERTSIEGIPIENSPDSIDIIVSVKDLYSLVPEAQVSSSKLSLGLKEVNFMGLGHQVNAYYSLGSTNSYQYSYSIPNISNTYINANVIYMRNADSTSLKQFSIERPFFSPLAKWAGGISISEQSYRELVNTPDSANYTPLLKSDIQDYWIARAFKIIKGDSEKDRTTKLILSARYYNVDFLKMPLPQYDPSQLYTDEKDYLFGIGLSKRKYIQDKYLFKYGFVEDIPVGEAINLVGGIQDKNDQKRLYLALKMSWGNYFKFGYLGTDIEYGSFFDGISTEQGVFTTQINYFTHLFEFGNWKFRQFVKPQIMIGINRLKNEAVSLNDYFGISGFTGENLTGTDKIVCSFQSQLYNSWNFYGFKFGPYFVYSLGMLGNDITGFNNSKVYSLFGIGTLIKNDHLLFNSFQFSISFYPYIPGNGNNILRLNAYETSDFGFQDFDVEKPIPIPYK